MLKNAIVGIFDSHRKTIRFCAASSFVILIAYSTLLLCWGYASNQAVRGKSQKAMVIYSQLYPYLSWRGIFLYDYSIESLYAGKYKQAYKIAEECRKKNLTYDLALMEGDICRCLNKYDDALRFFNEASYMCPVRFAPLHGKWQVYNQLRDYERADSMAHIIKHKDIKVYSADIKEIISEINKCTYH